MNLSYTRFENRLTSWQGGVISPTPDLMAVMEFLSQSRIHGQDFGTDNFFFISRSGLPKTDRQQMPALTSENEAAMSVDEWRLAIEECVILPSVFRTNGFSCHLNAAFCGI